MKPERTLRLRPWNWIDWIRAGIAVSAILVLALLLTGCGGGGSSTPTRSESGGATSGAFAVTEPAANPAYLSSNTDATLSGTCVDGDTVSIAGDMAPSGQTCTGGAFAFTLPAAADGTYQYFVTRTDAGGASELVAFTLVRDTVAPALVTISSPIVSPVVSSDATLSVWGKCETGATVTATETDGGGAPLNTQTVPCADQSFALELSRPDVANYRFELTQTDRAGNVSPIEEQLWARDASLPFTPLLTAPAPNPHDGNSAPLTVSGTCESATAHTVRLDDGSGFPITLPCAAGTFSTTLPAPAADGTSTWVISQADDIAQLSSAAAVLEWRYDTLPPAPPVVTSPTSPSHSPGPLVLTGTCETGATVLVDGDDTQSMACTAGSFTATIAEAADGTYNYTVAQTDRAGNSSTTTAHQWQRDAAAVPPPSITSHTASPVLTNTAALNLYGGCLDGYTVTLTEGAAAPLTTLCVGGTWALSVDRSADAADATYSLSVVQDDGVGGALSDPVLLVWQRDITAPVVTLSVAPFDPNPSADSRFEFTADETNVTFECSLDGAAYAGCSSPVSWFGLSAGVTHTLSIRARDAAGNVTVSPPSTAWTQEVYNTIALYHLDAAAPLLDSSAYLGALAGDLTVDFSSGAAAGPTGFAEGLDFVAASGDHASAPDNAKYAALRSIMTVEAFVKLASLPANGVPMALVSKLDASASPTEHGWAFGIQRVGGSPKYALYFQGSLDGVTLLSVRSGNLNAVNAGQFYHVAVTWNQGVVTFFLNGVPVGSKTLGTAGSAILWDSTAPLRLGASDDGATDLLDGVLDEVRLSQVVRYTGDFSASLPAAPFAAD